MEDDLRLVLAATTPVGFQARLAGMAIIDNPDPVGRRCS